MPQTTITNDEEYAKALWKALKNRLSVNPKTAVRIIILHEHDVLAAVKDVSKEYPCTQHKTP